MFSVTQFGRMLTDGVRHDAHLRVLQQVVRPESVVLDIGTGTGVYALLAAHLGARHVYAIDPNVGVQLGRQHAADNGLSDRVTFICGLSTELELPEPATVIVSDLRNTLPFNGRHFSAMHDARRRLLAPGGIVTPQRDVVYVGLVENAGLHAEVTGPWAAGIRGLDFSAALEIEANTPRSGRIRTEMLLAEPLVFADLDYESGDDLERPWSIDVTVPATRSGTAHGLGFWFDATVIDGVAYSTGPHGPETVYRNMYLPFRHPLEVSAGAPVRVEVSCRLNEGWDWQWMVSAGDRFCSPWRQSTLRAVLSPDELVERLRADG